MSDTVAVVMHCRRHLELADARLDAEYGYPCLPLCVLDAVFSIGVRYEAVRAVIDRYSAFAGLGCPSANAYRAGADEHTVDHMVAAIEGLGFERFASEVLCNHQRTSTQNGILKAEAALRFGRVLQGFGLQRLCDAPRVYWDARFAAAIKDIPGQRSGISLAYFFMLCGSTEHIKPDRMVTRFLADALGRRVCEDEAQRLITDACVALRSDYPHINPRLLDSLIWHYQRAT